jgi:predicted MFS family arabinose efflux permease
MVAAGMALFGVSSALLAVCPDVMALLPCRTLQGFASGLYFGAALQGVVRASSAREGALGQFNGSFVLGSVAGAPAGGLVASLVPGIEGYRVAFVACAVVSVVVGAALRWCLPPLPPGDPDTTARISFPQLGGTPGVAPILVLGTFSDLLRGGVVYTALPLAGQSRHLSTATIGVAIGLLSAVEIATLSTVGRVFGRVGILRCFAVALVLGIAAAALLALSSGLVPFVGGAALFGTVIGVSSLAPPLLLVSLHGDAPSGLASFRVASGFGMLVGSTGAGTVTTALGASGVFFAVAGLLFGGVLLAGVTGRRLRLGLKGLDA